MATNIPLTGKFKITCEYKKKGNWACGWHTGIDLISLENNDNIYATCDGIVVRIEADDKNYGNFIVVEDHVTGKYHWFCHLSRIMVKRGESVNRISRIGIMGNTGNSSGKHLHYEIRNTSNQYADNSNPASYMGIENKVGSYNSINYQIHEKDNNFNIGKRKILTGNTNIRESPSLQGKPHLYTSNTTVKILEEQVSDSDGYIWDKVEVVYAKPNDFKIGYIARTKNRYQ